VEGKPGCANLLLAPYATGQEGLLGGVRVYIYTLFNEKNHLAFLMFVDKFYLMHKATKH